MVKHTYCSAQRCSKIGKNGGNLKVGKANGWICKHSQVCWQNQVHDLNVQSIWFWSVSVNAWLKVLSCWEAPFCRSVAFQCEKQKLEELFFSPVSSREEKVTGVLRKFEASGSIHKIPQHYLFMALENCITAPSRIWQVSLTNAKKKNSH